MWVLKGPNEKFPADNTGHNNLAISYYFMLDFKGAMESAGRGLEIYPNNKTVISNYALFAMLAGEQAHEYRNSHGNSSN